jgi:hypothetical protein
VFHIDITECEQCQGSVKIIACIEDPIVIEKILAHLTAKEERQDPHTGRLPLPRGPPLPPDMDQGLIN